MPEMHFVARWPDEAVHTYYSPSLVVAEFLSPGTTYALPDFIARSRTALRIASDRVREKYGFACPRAARTLAQIEAKASEFDADPNAVVHVAPGGAEGHI